MPGAQIDAFSTTDGHLARSIAASGAGQQFFSMGLAMDATGRTYVADMMEGARTGLWLRPDAHPDDRSARR